jgi:nitroreductase
MDSAAVSLPRPGAADIDLPVADRLLTTTRAVRRRLDLTRPVERQLLLDSIAIAQQAPTGGNSQGWSFVVVTQPGVRAELARIYREASGDYFERARRKAAERGDAQTGRVYEGAAHLAAVLDRVPVHVIPCLHGRIPAEGTTNARAAGFYASIYPAVWNLMLALRARGLGSALTTMHLAREAEVAELLGIPDDVSQVALIPVAHYTGDTFSPAARPPAATITHWNGWAGSEDPR